MRRTVTTLLATAAVLAAAGASADTYSHSHLLELALPDGSHRTYYNGLDLILPEGSLRTVQPYPWSADPGVLPGPTPGEIEPDYCARTGSCVNPIAIGPLVPHD